jgi:ComF family protein
MSGFAWNAAVRTTLNALLGAVLAPRCAACTEALDAPLNGPVCTSCWASIRPLLPPLCITCGDQLPSWRTVSLALARCARCRRSSSLLVCSRSAGDYSGALRGIIQSLKYEGRRTLARPLARLMRDAGADVLADADCLVPVPLHPLRHARRGFNQAGDLARALDLRVVQALWRRRATVSQTGLTAAGRRRNVSGAFRLSPLMTRRSLDSHICGRIVVLVDDVRTTGATLEACASVLRDAGAHEVRALTAASRAIRLETTPHLRRG